ncbi:FtsK/SpoIIIE domain-containing protein [[Mycoplasma] testudinis]|uniref:FtsK/SpoIIIE domain-containing protein n=1 Tax=[Mycoplasma] testudinis TaxID=33924 RepID=UPI00048410A6|nr:FtsK/SpoIIIE domain-containing protein [[Mycoplasma] testudinis]
MTKNNLVTQRLTTTADNKNTKQLVWRLLAGIGLIVFPIVFLVRVPYFGEFFDGVFFDLLFFGTAKYFAYVMLIAAGVIFLIIQKNYWRVLISKRWIISFVIVMIFLALIFAIANYFQRWANVNPINIRIFLGNYFNSWKADVFVTGSFVWAHNILVNGGLWWTLLVAINAQVPIVLFFILLIILILIIVLIIGFKLKWKKLQWLKERIVVWFGGFNKKTVTKANIVEEEFVNPYTIKIDTSDLSKSNEIPSHIVRSATDVVIPSQEVTQHQQNLNSTEQLQTQTIIPFSLRQKIYSDLTYDGPINNIGINNYDKNYEYAKTAMLNLTDFFVIRSIKVFPKNFACGPSMISIWYELDDPSVVKEFTKYKDEIQAALKVKQFDIYLKANVLEVQIPVPNTNQISFKEINELIANSIGLHCAIGKNQYNQSWTLPLQKYPVVLLTGILGSGKGMLLTSLVLSLVINNSPSQLMLSIIDTRSGHLSRFGQVPHLVTPVANTVNSGFNLFEEALVELKYRVKLLRKYGVDTISEYNKLPDISEPIKPLVLVINDFQDLLESDSDYIYKFLSTVHQYALRLSVHLILVATEIDGLLFNEDTQNHFDLIFAFKAQSPEESQLLLNKNYLAKLYGRGDFVMVSKNSKELVRGLSCYVDNNELNKILKALNQEKLN